MTENCPICNPKRDDEDIIEDIRARFKEGYTLAMDHSLMLRAIDEIKKLRKRTSTCGDEFLKETNVAVALRSRIASEPCPGTPDHKLHLWSLREIDRLRTSVKSMTGQLEHIGHLGTTMANNVRRNLKIDGGWEP
jgi:hypothetical protein